MSSVTNNLYAHMSNDISLLNNTINFFIRYETHVMIQALDSALLRVSPASSLCAVYTPS